MKTTLQEIEQTLRHGLRIIGAWKRRLNAYDSHEKMIARGTKPGRRKIRNDAAIREDRNLGFSIRQIAARQGISTTAVQRALKE